nr:hypothetical protein [uncultured Desulfobulbus sp.]
MTYSDLFETLKKIPIGARIPGLTSGKIYSFVSVQKYGSKGKHAYLTGNDVVILHSEKRKNRRIILFIHPLLLLVNATETELSYGNLPYSYIEKYRSGGTTGLPNLHEYESHYKSLARYIQRQTTM